MSNAAVRWALQTLNTKNYKCTTDMPVVIQDNQWSVVFRISTDKGYVFLKVVPQKLFLETEVIELLHNKYHANVPAVIATSEEHLCFLMVDAGIQLYHHFKHKFMPDVLVEALDAYTALQINSTDSIQKLIDLGVPDWRTQKLPSLYQHLILQEELLLGDGMTRQEIFKLNQLAPKLSELCHELSSFKIIDTFGHADFHDKNILINPTTGVITIIDLGEVVITHPFFSFHNCLHKAMENFNLTRRQHQELLYRCLIPWTEYESLDNLLNAISLISKCWSIHSVLGEYRLIYSLSEVDRNSLKRQGRLANNLRHWLQG